MIRAGGFALALVFGMCCLAHGQGFSEGPGGIIYGDPGAQQPPGYQQPAYIADPNEPSEVPYAEAEAALLTRGPAIFNGGYFRTEYLNWTFQEHGDTLLGAPIVGNPNPRQPFVVSDPVGTPLGIAIVPSTQPFKLRHNNGLRLTGGAELLSGGTIEASAFLLDKAQSSFTLFGEQQANPGQPYNLIGTSTFVNGALGNNIEFYNVFFRAEQESRFWGGNLDYIFDNDRSGVFTLRPLVGARYISLNERLTQTGVFRDNTFAVPVDTQSTIESTSWNNIVGPQVGFHTAIQTKYLQFGVTPKFGVGANSQKARVYTSRLRSIQDPDVTTNDYYTGVTPFFELGAYGQANIRPNLSLRVGYNFLWMGRVNRPEDNILYNDNGPQNIPDVVVSPTRHSLHIGGLTVGGEYRW